MVELESKIVRVQVFRRGAQVTRAAQLPAGTTRASLAGLPVLLDDGSIRARIVDDTATAVSALRVSSAGVSLSLSASEWQRPAKNEALQAAKLQEARARSRYEQALRELEALDALQIHERKRVEQMPPRVIGVEPRLALLEFRAARWEVLTRRARSDWQAWDAAHRQLAEELDRDARASSATEFRPEQLSKCLTLAIDGPTASETPLWVELSYVVPGARWLPRYRLDIADGEASLTCQALIAQASGEDWDQVALTVSTALPVHVTRLPELRALRIGRAQPSPPRGYRPPPEGLDRLFADFDGARRERPAPPQPPRRLAPPPLARTLTATQVPRAAGRPRSEHKPQPEHAEGMAVAAAAEVQPSFAAAPPLAAPAAPLAAAPAGLAAFGAAPQSIDLARRSMAKDRTAAPPLDDDSAQLTVVQVADEPLPAEQWLRHDELSMPGPRSKERGRLSALPLDLPELAGAQANPLAVYRARATSAEQRAVPPGYTAPDDSSEPSVLHSEAVADVPSDGRDHLHRLSSKKAPCLLRHLVVPGEDAHAYRTVSFDNPTELGLLAGPVDVFIDDAFVLSSTLPATPRGGRVEIGLGVDEGIRVARNVHFEETTAGLLRSDVLLRHRIEVRLLNSTATPVNVEVRERVPVVTEGEKDLAVELGSVNPKWQAYTPSETPLEGGYRWNAEIAAGGELTLQAQYDIRIPAKLELVGGNRRDA